MVLCLAGWVTDVVLPVSLARLFDILGVVDALIHSVQFERMCLRAQFSSWLDGATVGMGVPFSIRIWFTIRLKPSI